MSYSAQEVMAILDKAKANGVRFIKVPGFEATWDVGAHQAPPAAKPAQKQGSQTDELGDYVIPIGRNFKGRTLREVPKAELRSFGEYLLRDADEGNALSDAAKEFLDKADRWLRRA